MKKLFAAIALCFAFCTSAFATDYFEGSCLLTNPITIDYAPGTNQWTDGTAGPGTTCQFQSGPTYATSFSDTMTFVLTKWSASTYNPPAEYVPSSTQTITATNGQLCSGGGRGGAYHCYDYVIIDSATIDGIPMNPPAPGGHSWTLGVELVPQPVTDAPSTHVLAVTGHGDGVSYHAAHWKMNVGGVEFVLQAAPQPAAPPPCNDCGGD